MIKFITLSRLMSSHSLSGMSTVELQTQLQTSLCEETISSCTHTQLPAKLKAMIGTKSPKAWMEALVVYFYHLQARNVQYFVLDTLQFLDKSDLGQVTQLLQHLSNSGIDVIAIDRHRTPLFFTAMRAILCTDDFMDIYLQSMWYESMSLQSPVPRQIQKKFSPAEFQPMKRIFVA